MAINAFGFEVPDQPKPQPKQLTKKQIENMLRQQRQQKGRQEQASRDRQRDADRKREAERLAAVEEAREQRAKQKREAQEKIDEALAAKKVTTDDVEYLKNSQGEEREQREMQLLQSLRDRGVFVYEENGRATWVEETDDNWDVVFSKSNKYTSIYSGDDFAKLLEDF